MKLPSKYRELLLSGRPPGEIYRECLEQMAQDGQEADYELTETLVYATEIRYALGILQDGAPEKWWNFGDVDGQGDRRLWQVLDGVDDRRIAFVGSGPYPITALQLPERYPGATITCVDNNVVAHLVSQAVFARLGMPIRAVFAEALEVDYAPFSVVVVAAMVSGKRRLAAHVLETSQATLVVKGQTGLTHPRLVEIHASFADDGRVLTR